MVYGTRVSWKLFVAFLLVLLATFWLAGRTQSADSVLELDGSERVISLNPLLVPFTPGAASAVIDAVDAVAGADQGETDGDDPIRDSILDYDTEGEFTENAERALMEQLEAAVDGKSTAPEDAADPIADQIEASEAPVIEDAYEFSRPADLYRLRVANRSDRGFDRVIVVRQPVLYGSLFADTAETPLTLDNLYNTLSPYFEGVEEASLLPTEQIHRVRLFGKPATGSTKTAKGEPAAEMMDFAFDFNRKIGNERIYLWDPAAYGRHARAMILFHGLAIGLMIAMVALLLGTWFFTEATFYLVASLFVTAGLIFTVVGFGYIPSVVMPFAAFVSSVPALEPLAGHTVSITDLALVLVAVAGIGLLRSVLTFDPSDFVHRRGAMYVQYGLIGLAAVSLVSFPFHTLVVRGIVALVVMYGFYLILRQRKKGMMGARLSIPGWIFILLAFATAVVASVVALPIPYYYFHPAVFGAFVFGSLLIGFALFSQAASGPFTGLAFRSASAAATGEAALMQPTSLVDQVAALPRHHDPDRYELGLNATQQGLWDWTVQGDRLFLSAFVNDLLGADDDAPFATTEEDWYKRIHPRDQKSYRNALFSYLTLGNVSFALKFRIRDKQGRYRHLELRAACMPDKNKKPYRCIGTVVDLNADEPLTADGEEVHLDVVPKVEICELTGLLKRDSYVQESGRALDALRADDMKMLDKSPAMLVIEFDRFPVLNEGLGRESGDKLLQAFAQRLVSIADADDVVGRIGGDEFSIFTSIPSDLSPDELAKQAQDILAQPMDVDGKSIHPSATIGTAIWTGDGHSVEEMLKEAEKALSQAKEAGRQASVEHYRPGMGEKASEALALEADLRRALDRYEMEVFFQPIMDLRAGRIAGFEALLRWNHPEKGMLGPDTFVPIAEEVGLIVRLSRFTLSMAAIQLSQWQQFFELDTPLFVSVNVSTKQLLGEGLVSDISEMLKSVELQPGSLKLEITEGALIEDEDEAKRILGELNALDVDLVLDDYGTGHSSLDRLKNYPFSSLKIDKSFVSEIDRDTDAEVIVRNAIKMAAELGMDVVAEGVEREAVGRKLYQLKCTYAQGFVFGAPMSAMDAQAFIANYWAK